MSRRDANRTIKELQELADMMFSLTTEARLVLLKDRISGGRKQRSRDEYGDPRKPGSMPRGTPPPSHGDPTGEDAIFADLPDPFHNTILRLIDSLHHSYSLARDVLDQATHPDAVKRAEKNIPDCKACSEPCLGGQRHGLCNKCRMRRERMGTGIKRPTVEEFIWIAKQEALKSRAKSGQGK